VPGHWSGATDAFASSQLSLQCHSAHQSLQPDLWRVLMALRPGSGVID
jgi:hypothetical protein